MIFVLSPAKALDYESPLATPRFTQPEYLADAAELITALRELSHAQVAELMHLSDACHVWPECGRFRGGH